MVRSLHKRFGWYVSRLRSFERGETWFRVRETVRRARWSSSVAGWQSFDGIGDGEIGDLPRLAARLAADGPAAQSFREAADRLARGELSFLGKPWWPLHAADGTIDPAFWFHDPVSGAAWPGEKVKAFAVPLRWTGEERGDVKFVWEANRLAFLQAPAAHVALTGDPGTRARILKVLRAWYAANPPGRGVNWASGLELAMRCVTFAIVLAALRPDTLTREERVLMRRLVGAHARQLAAFPSLHSSANNHRIAEGLGLLLCGRMAPDFPEAPAWTRQGLAIVEEETLRQIAPDGVGLEQSPTYQAFVLEMVAFAGLVAADGGEGLSGAVRGRLAASSRFLSSICDDRLNVPRIGDDDEGRVLAGPYDREPGYVASVAASVAGFLGRPDLAPRLGRAEPGDVPRPAAALRGAVFEAVDYRPHEPDGPVAVDVFSQGGYSVIRDTVEGRSLHLVFDHGPLGLGALAAHGHADALSVWLSIDGVPVFVDAGTWLYHSGGPARTRIREARAHNTLVVAGRSPSVATGAFGWRSRSDARFGHVMTGSGWEVAGSHAGYLADFGAMHARRIARRDEGIAIVDTLQGAQELLPVELRFLVNPDLDLEMDGDRAIVSLAGAELLRLRPPAGFAAALRDEADGVWVSRAFGTREPGRALVLLGAAKPGMVLTTRLEVARAAALANPLERLQVVGGADLRARPRLPQHERT